MPVMTDAVRNKPRFAAIKMDVGSNWTMAMVVEVADGAIDVQGVASLLGGVSSQGIGTPN